MEEINWFFNSDFEEKLFADQFDSFHSSKQTQEFEYFINLLDPETSIYTTKKYDQEYLMFFKELTGFSFRSSRIKKNIQPWCQFYQNIELLKRWQSKIHTLPFFKKIGLIKHELEVINSADKLSEGYLYKDPYELSGRGHYHYPKDKEKLLKLIKKKKLIKEELLKRTKDFSTLVENSSVQCIYQNFVDDYFQYKGTLIAADFALKDDQTYLKQIATIMQYLEEYKGIYSIDSFLYQKNEELLIQAVSEINMRKTMGYIAYKLKEKYFQDKNFFQLKLVRNTKSIDHLQILNHFSKQAMVISPNTNIFHVYIIGGDTSEQMTSLERELLTAFF